MSLLSCLLVPAPVAVALAMMALVRMRNNARLTGRRLAIAAIVISAVTATAVLMGLVLSPSLNTDPVRSRQTEAGANLRELFIRATQHYAKHQRYTADFAALEFKPEVKSRYAYVTAAQPISVDLERTVVMAASASVSEAQLREVLAGRFAGDIRPGVTGVCPDECEFSVIAVGNVDDDAFLDVWSMSTKARVAPDGSKIDPGAPFNDADDSRN